MESDEEAVSLQEEQQYKTHMLVYLGKLYSERGWIMQYHINAKNYFLFENQRGLISRGD